MISLWQFTSFPTKVSFYQAQNFKAELTREFLKRVGCSPIWYTPRHPEANSVERTVGTIKSMISKVAIQYPKQWQKFIDLIMWAMRESVNETEVEHPIAFFSVKLNPTQQRWSTIERERGVCCADCCQ